MPAPELHRHSCECLCASCEAQGAGYFAQRAALAGDPRAAERLSPAVFVALATERGRKRGHGRVPLVGAYGHERRTDGAR